MKPQTQRLVHNCHCLYTLKLQLIFAVCRGQKELLVGWPEPSHSPLNIPFFTYVQYKATKCRDRGPVLMSLHHFEGPKTCGRS